MKKIPKILLSRIIGLMIFLIILGVLNLVHVNLRVYSIWVSFLNDNAVLLIIMSLIFMIAEIFFELIFPLNLGAPIFSSTASMLLVTFIFRIFSVIDLMLMTRLFSLLWPLSIIVYPIVFVAVFIGGYISIFCKLGKKKKRKHRKSKNIKKNIADTFRDIANEIEKE